jgi:hypothetical protein
MRRIETSDQNLAGSIMVAIELPIYDFWANAHFVRANAAFAAVKKIA